MDEEVAKLPSDSQKTCAPSASLTRPEHPPTARFLPPYTWPTIVGQASHDDGNQVASALQHEFRFVGVRRDDRGEVAELRAGGYRGDLGRLRSEGCHSRLGVFVPWISP